MSLPAIPVLPPVGSFWNWLGNVYLVVEAVADTRTGEPVAIAVHEHNSPNLFTQRFDTDTGRWSDPRYIGKVQ